MVLLKVNAKGVTLHKFKRDAPWTIDVNGVTDGLETFQRMKVKARNIQVCGMCCGIQSIKAFKNSAMEPAIDLAYSD